MTLARLSLTQFRHFSSFNTALHPRINVITGPNGSGKTSVLEALYLLSCARSFRTHETGPLICHGQSVCTVFAELQDGQTVSLQKSSTAITQVKMNGLPCLSTSELAREVPAQVFYQDLFGVIDASATIRRKMLDWGLFHVKHAYHIVFKRYERALKQRNALLKRQSPLTQLIPWNNELDSLAEQLDTFRSEYVMTLNKTFQEVLRELTPLEGTFHYYKGWDRKAEGKSLATVLVDCCKADFHRGYTYYGPHHADLIFLSNQCKMKQYLSRGQQKIVIYALKIAQTRHLQKTCLFLMDDIITELDDEHIQRLMQFIQKSPGQFFITLHDERNITRYLESSSWQTIALPPS